MSTNKLQEYKEKFNNFLEKSVIQNITGLRSIDQIKISKNYQEISYTL
jgi:hypothetical protein